MLPQRTGEDDSVSAVFKKNDLVRIGNKRQPDAFRWYRADELTPVDR